MIFSGCSPEENLLPALHAGIGIFLALDLGPVRQMVVELLVVVNGEIARLHRPGNVLPQIHSHVDTERTIGLVIQRILL